MACVGSRTISAGSFLVEEEAARAYDSLIVQYFSRPILNFDAVTGERNTGEELKVDKNLGPLPAALPYLRKTAAGMTGTSSYRGVTLRLRTGNWEASIAYRGRQVFVGVYATEEMAARGHDTAVSRFFGRPALNFDCTGLPNPDRKVDRHR